ncbi:MAG TPA: hypothetical protein VF662_09435 [Allosphingosinicella sp.]|jgi:hypothetical protein
MHMTAIRIEHAAPLSGSDDDGVRAIGGLAIGLAISLLIWLVPLAAWLLLR